MKRFFLAFLLLALLPVLAHGAIVTRYFSVGLPTSGSLSLVYVVTANTITRAAGSFVTDGFVNGDTISIQGTASNNGVFTIASVSALVITTNEALANETVTSIINKGDGSSWALRTNLFAGGTWSGRIILFAFNASDSLKCFIGPGTYTTTLQLQSSTFTTAPTIANALFFVGCDSSGNQLAIPDANWVSCQPAWDTSTLPALTSATDSAMLNLAHLYLTLIKITLSNRTGAAVSLANAMEWCYVENSTASTSAIGVNSVTRAYGSIFRCTGSSYNSVMQSASGGMINNCRIEGVTGASGNRRGIDLSGNNQNLSQCTIVNNGGPGLISTSSGTSQRFVVQRCVIANNGGAGAQANSTASQVDFYDFSNSAITGNGGYGIDGNSAAGRVLVVNSRFRDNTSGDMTGMGNYPTDLPGVYTTDSDDASEYVSAGANGDFTIKKTATIWGMGFGVAEQAAGGGQTSSSR